MKKENRNKLIITVFVCLLPMVLGIILYDLLPEQMPIHYTIGNNPDKYEHKIFVLFGIPLIMAIIQSIFMIGTINKLKNEEKSGIIKMKEWFIPIITVVLYSIIIKAAL